MSDTPITYNRISTGIRLVGRRYHLTVCYDNTDTGHAHHETSTKSFADQREAEQAAVKLAHELRDKLAP